jgi:ABC-type transporter Mla subunit MlaD
MSVKAREHLTERVSIARLLLELSRSQRSLIILLIGVVAGLGSWVYIFSKIGANPFTSHHTVRFMVSDATGVVGKRDEVRIKGIPAGTITDVSFDHGTPVITASIESKYGQVYNNAHANLRPATALQNMYLDVVDLGSPSAGVATAGHPLPSSSTDTSVNVADVLQALDPNVRAHMAVLLRDLGGGLADRGAKLRTAFVELVPFVETAGRITEQLAARSSLTKRLVHDVGVLTGALGERQVLLHRLVTEGAKALTTLQSHAGDLSATLHELPPTLSLIQSSFTAVQAALPDLDHAVQALYPVADQLPGGLTALRRLSADAAPAVAALQTPVARLVPFSEALSPLASSLRQVIGQLSPDTGAIDHVTQALDRCTKNGAVQGFFQWTASLGKLQDVSGEVPRGDATVGLDSIAGIKSPLQAPSRPTCVTTAPLGGTP